MSLYFICVRGCCWARCAGELAVEFDVYHMGTICCEPRYVTVEGKYSTGATNETTAAPIANTYTPRGGIDEAIIYSDKASRGTLEP